MRYALIDENNIVRNVIVHDGAITEWDGMQAVGPLEDDAITDIGYIYILKTKKFADPATLPNRQP